MDITKSTYELLKPIVDAIDKSISIDSVIELTPYVDPTLGIYQINACNTKWAAIGFSLIINDNQYKITSVNPNVSITVTGTVLPIKSVFNLYVPKFYHGTIKATEEDLNAQVNNNLLSIDKLPMIWLHEPVEESNDPQEENAIARVSDCDLYFINEANFAGWSNDDHYKYAIKPMRQLFMAFYDSMKKSGLVDDSQIKTIRTTDLPRFGRYTAYTGAKTTIFAEYEMSGTRVNMGIPFIRSRENCCN